MIPPVLTWRVFCVCQSESTLNMNLVIDCAVVSFARIYKQCEHVLLIGNILESMDKSGAIQLMWKSEACNAAMLFCLRLTIIALVQTAGATLKPPSFWRASNTFSVFDQRYTTHFINIFIGMRK